MKAILEFEMYEESETFNDAINGTKYRSQIEDIWLQCFRPANKHGYNNPEIQHILEKHGDDTYRLIELLGEIYHKVVNDE